MSKSTTPHKPTLSEIYTSFLRVGGLLFGGGYAMLPLLEREVVDRRKWCSHTEMSDYYAMAQLVPGVIAINTSMLIAHKLRRLPGTIVAMIGVVTIPFLVLLLYASAVTAVADSPLLAKAMAGLRPAVAGLMLGVAFNMYRRGWRTQLGRFLPLLAAGAILLLRISPVQLILIGLAAGILWYLITLKHHP